MSCVLELKCQLEWGSGSPSTRGGWGGGGELGGLNKVFDGEAGSRGPTPYLIKKTIFDRKGTPFLYFLLASIDK